MDDLECSECGLEYRHGENCPNGLTTPRDREAMARKIVEKYFSGGDADGEALIVDFAQALLEFAEEAVKQSWANELTATAVGAERYEIMRKAKAKEAIDQIKQQAHASGYAEALEKAAKIADRQDQSAWGIAREIRALLPKGVKDV